MGNNFFYMGLGGGVANSSLLTVPGEENLNIKLLGYQGVLRVSSVSIVNILSLCAHCNFVKQNQKFTDLKKKIIHKPSLWTCEVLHKIWARSVQSF